MKNHPKSDYQFHFHGDPCSIHEPRMSFAQVNYTYSSEQLLLLVAKLQKQLIGAVEEPPRLVPSEQIWKHKQSQTDIMRYDIIDTAK